MNKKAERLAKQIVSEAEKEYGTIPIGHRMQMINIYTDLLSNIKTGDSFEAFIFNEKTGDCFTKEYEVA